MSRLAGSCWVKHFEHSLRSSGDPGKGFSPGMMWSRLHLRKVTLVALEKMNRVGSRPLWGSKKEQATRSTCCPRQEHGSSEQVEAWGQTECTHHVPGG